MAQILREQIGAVREKNIKADIAVLDEGIGLSEPTTGRVRLMRTDAGILVEGQVESEVLVPCGRCLTPYPVSLKAALEEEFLAGGQFASPDRGAEEGADPALRIDEQHMLDLQDVIRQQLLLALPNHPVCRSDCAGMCAHCGQDLNDGPCECTEERDPRWDALLRLQLVAAGDSS